MNYRVESMVLKAMAVTALAAAVLIMGVVTARSGLLDRSSGDETSTVSVSDAGSAAGGDQAAAEDAGSQEPLKASRKHVVEEGDSFYSISRKYNVSIDDIKKLNPDLDVQHLTPGITIAIP